MRGRGRARQQLLAVVTLAGLGAAVLWTVDLAAQSPAPPTSATGDAGQVWSGCSELVPKTATRPKMQSSLPEDGIAGYAVELTIVIEHGPGETVMPGGFRIERGADAIRALEQQGWVLPEPDGGAGPLIDRPPPDSDSNVATTTLKVPFVPLPPEPGRHTMVLPSLPITVARASGELMTLCTEQQEILIEDPIANEVEPEVRPNPPPRPQREVWKEAQIVAIAVASVLLVGALLGWLFARLNQRFKPEPVEAKMLPWIAAVKELNALRDSSLLNEERYDELIDAVDDVTRRYLGDRYGFDGIESTSSEIRETLARVYPRIKCSDEISDFLADTDLIKFAKVMPDREQCQDALDRAFEIVRATTPPGVVRIDVDGPPTRRNVA